MKRYQKGLLAPFTPSELNELWLLPYTWELDIKTHKLDSHQWKWAASITRRNICQALEIYEQAIMLYKSMFIPKSMRINEPGVHNFNSFLIFYFIFSFDLKK